MTDEERNAIPAATGPLSYERILIEVETIAASWHDELDANQVYKLGRQIIKLVDRVRDDCIDELHSVYGEIAKLKKEAANPRQSDAPAWRAYEIMVDNLEAAKQEIAQLRRFQADDAIAYMAQLAAKDAELARLREELAEAKANERKPMRVISHTDGDDALISYLMDDEEDTDEQ